MNSNWWFLWFQAVYRDKLTWVIEVVFATWIISLIGAVPASRPGNPRAGFTPADAKDRSPLMPSATGLIILLFLKLITCFPRLFIKHQTVYTNHNLFIHVCSKAWSTTLCQKLTIIERGIFINREITSWHTRSKFLWQSISKATIILTFFLLILFGGWDSVTLLMRTKVRLD